MAVRTMVLYDIVAENGYTGVATNRVLRIVAQKVLYDEAAAAFSGCEHFDRYIIREPLANYGFYITFPQDMQGYANAAAEEPVMAAFAEFCGDALLVSYNGVYFDARLLRAALRNHGIVMTNCELDLLLALRKLKKVASERLGNDRVLSGTYENISAVAESLGISAGVVDDPEYVILVMKELITYLTRNVISQLSKRQLGEVQNSCVAQNGISGYYLPCGIYHADRITEYGCKQKSKSLFAKYASSPVQAIDKQTGKEIIIYKVRVIGTEHPECPLQRNEKIPPVPVYLIRCPRHCGEFVPFIFEQDLDAGSVYRNNAHYLLACGVYRQNLVAFGFTELVDYVESARREGLRIEAKKVKQIPKKCNSA